jgi:hypothetical protein
MSSYRHPLIVEVPPSAGNSNQHQTFLPPKEQIVTVIKKITRIVRFAPSLTRFLGKQRVLNVLLRTRSPSSLPQPPVTISAVIVLHHHDKMTHKHQSWYRLPPPPLQEDDNNQRALDVHRCWWNQHPPCTVCAFGHVGGIICQLSHIPPAHCPSGSPE